MGSHSEEFELEKIRAEIVQEKQMKEMLEQSLGELQLTVDELEKRVDSVGDENNEWKTRYETQMEMNDQLDQQIQSLAEKVEEARQTMRDSKLPRNQKVFDIDGVELTPHYVKNLEKDRNALDGQLRDMEWRLDQESKAYHKANEERKTYVTELNAAKGTIEHLKYKQSTDKSPVTTPRGGVGNSNLAPNQRIIDPKRGPIKKTAAVQRLPRLD